jgi:hypothetical protein
MDCFFDPPKDSPERYVVNAHALTVLEKWELIAEPVTPMETEPSEGYDRPSISGVVNPALANAATSRIAWVAEALATSDKSSQRIERLNGLVYIKGAETFKKNSNSQGILNRQEVPFPTQHPSRCFIGRYAQGESL